MRISQTEKKNSSVIMLTKRKRDGNLFVRFEVFSIKHVIMLLLGQKRPSGDEEINSYSGCKCLSLKGNDKRSNLVSVENESKSKVSSM